ncbi:hypothetical protein CON22_24965 [Bacillus cereus]|nr:hypothetical protein CON22_24965 [Bacillus cereus]
MRLSEKIKKVELEAFRAYEEKQIFDFRDLKNQVSNLVVIYAPNGSGKTTLFDAIEWVMSGKIQRISANKQAKEVADKEKNYILKNRYSDLEKGKVNIEFSNGNYIKAETKKIDGNRKTDYKPGEIITSLNDKNTVEDFVKKNILTHHQIDSFLRFHNSKDRYDALSVFWDHNKESELYKNLILFIKDINSHKQKLVDNLVLVKKDLEKLTIAKETVKIINHKLDQINKLSGEQILPLLQEDLNLQDVYDLCKEKKKELMNLVLELKQVIKEIQDFYLEYDENFSKIEVENSHINNVLIPEKYVIIQKFAELRKKASSLEVLKSTSQRLQENTNQLVFLNDNKSEFDSIETNISEALTQLNSYTSKKSKIEEEILSYKDWFTANEIEIRNLSMKYEETSVNIDRNNKIKILPNLIDNFKIVESEFNEVRVNLEDIQKKELQVNKNKERFKEKLNFEHFNFLDQEATLLDLDGESKEKYEEVCNLEVVKHEFSQQFDSKKKEIEKLKTIGNDLDKLKKIGLELVNKSKSSSCPLCKKEYDNYELLIKNLESNAIETQLLKQAIEDLEILGRSRDEIVSRLKFAEKEFKKCLLTKIESCQKDLDSLAEKSIILNKKYYDYKQKRDNLRNEKSKLLSITNAAGLGDTLIEDLEATIEIKNNELNQEMVAIIEKKNSQKETMDMYQEKLTKLQSELLSVSININKINEKIIELNADNLYVSYKNLKILIDIKDNLEIKKNLESLYFEKEKLEREIEQVNEEVNILKSELINFKENEIQVEYEKLQTQANKLEIIKSNLINKRNKYFQNELLNAEVFNEKYQALSENSTLIQDQITLIDQIINILTGYLNNNFKKEKQESFNKLRDECARINDKVRRLESLKIRAYNYIQERIKSVFDLGTINTILQMIDPLQNKTKIDFKLDDSNKDAMLGLDIIYRDAGKNDLGQAPILYLSSAQVNILSLSIFLASAIENTQFFNSILMDDPLQHLDGLHILSFIDLIRIIAFEMDKQIIISTHNQTFFNLCQRKIDPKYFSVKYFDLSPK